MRRLLLVVALLPTLASAQVVKKYSAVGIKGLIDPGVCLTFRNTNGTVAQKWCPSGSNELDIYDSAGGIAATLGLTVNDVNTDVWLKDKDGTSIVYWDYLNGKFITAGDVSLTNPTPTITTTSTTAGLYLLPQLAAASTAYALTIQPANALGGAGGLLMLRDHTGAQVGWMDEGGSFQTVSYFAATNYFAYGGTPLNLGGGTSPGAGGPNIKLFQGAGQNTSETNGDSMVAIYNDFRTTKVAEISSNGALTLNVQGGGSKPACAVGQRGKMWRVEGGAGVADTFEICTKDAADAYAWRALY